METTNTAIADNLPLEPDPRRAQDIWDMYCLDALEPAAKCELANLLLSDPAITNEPRQNFDYSLWDAQAWELSQIIWQIESVANISGLAVRDDSKIGDQVYGAFSAIAQLTKQCQEMLEVDLMRPVEKVFKSN